LRGTLEEVGLLLVPGLRPALGSRRQRHPGDEVHLDLNTITYFMRGAIFVIPPLVFIFAKRWCISLQRHDNDMLLHGYESGIIMRDAQGGYSEKHLPLSEGHAYTLTARAP